MKSATVPHAGNARSDANRRDRSRGICLMSRARTECQESTGMRALAVLRDRYDPTSVYSAGLSLIGILMRSPLAAASSAASETTVAA